MTYKEMVLAEKAKHPEMNIRYLAFVTDQGNGAFKGNVIGRKHHFINWIADRKRDYIEAKPHMVLGSKGFETVVDQADFTNFIISGEWK